jgi:hypothetical protein
VVRGHSQPGRIASIIRVEGAVTAVNWENALEGHFRHLANLS